MEWQADECPLCRILLQKSKVVSARIFGETKKREVIDDSDNLSRATEVTCEFCVRRRGPSDLLHENRPRGPQIFGYLRQNDFCNMG
jgi:hypothetical protein